MRLRSTELLAIAMLVVLPAFVSAQPARAVAAGATDELGVHWQPGHWFSLLKPFRRGDLSVTEMIGREIVSLPMHPFLERSQVQYIADAGARFLQSAGTAAPSKLRTSG